MVFAAIPGAVIWIGCMLWWRNPFLYSGIVWCLLLWGFLDSCASDRRAALISATNAHAYALTEWQRVGAWQWQRNNPPAEKPTFESVTGPYLRQIQELEIRLLRKEAEVFRLRNGGE